MKLAIMQPYFFPYMGYFELISQVDVFVAYDTAQFPRQGWVNRNRILDADKGWKYLTVPLSKASFTQSFKTEIRFIRASEQQDWGRRILDELEPFREHAPHFEAVRALVEQVVTEGEQRIAHIDMQACRKIAQYLGMSFEFVWASDIDQVPKSGEAQEKVLWMCEQLGADSYINLSGGRELYDTEDFRSRGIALRFLEPREFSYSTPGFEFQERLSMIDVLFWNSVDVVRAYLSATRMCD